MSMLAAAVAAAFDRQYFEFAVIARSERIVSLWRKSVACAVDIYD